MESCQLRDDARPVPRPAVRYARPFWTAELRRIEAQILRGVSWS